MVFFDNEIARSKLGSLSLRNYVLDILSEVGKLEHKSTDTLKLLPDGTFGGPRKVWKTI